MRVKSYIFTDFNYSALVDRIESVLEALVNQKTEIIAVTITAQSGSTSYVGTIFYKVPRG